MASDFVVVLTGGQLGECRLQHGAFIMLSLPLST